MQNLSVPFIFQGVSDENRACSISIRFFTIKDPFDGRSFLMCSHDPFFGTNKTRILENGSCEQAFRLSTVTGMITLKCFQFCEAGCQ